MEVAADAAADLLSGAVGKIDGEKGETSRASRAACSAASRSAATTSWAVAARSAARSAAAAAAVMSVVGGLAGRGAELLMFVNYSPKCYHFRPEMRRGMIADGMSR